jgi:hypothetical protein
LLLSFPPLSLLPSSPIKIRPQFAVPIRTMRELKRAAATKWAN